MNKIIKMLAFACIVFSYNVAFSQCPCDDITIIELRDTTISGQAGFILRLTSDTSNCGGGYSDFWFIDQLGDTLNEFTGSGMWLPNPLDPRFDTTRYIIQLKPAYSGFPIDFSGNLQIVKPSCTIPFTYSTLTTTERIDVESRIQIFPNPTNDIVGILNKSAFVITSIEIYNAEGKFIAGKAENIDIIEVGPWVPGVYYAKLYSMDRLVAVKKLVKN